MSGFSEDVVMPLVSVVITTFHNETYLPRAIESVLEQTYPQVELIVVDDNPPDTEERRATEAVMEGYPQCIYLKHPENLNGAAARNTGIRISKGKYIAFLDNDDIYMRTHIADCVQALEEHPECGGAFCSVIKVRQGIYWEIVPPLSGNIVSQILLSETSLGTGSNLFVRAERVKKIGGFDVSFRRHQDLEFAVRFFSDSCAFGIDRIQIVKVMDGYSNMPDYEKFLQIKEHFADRFKNELDALTDQEKKKYYESQYSSLLYAACRNGGKKQIANTALHLKKYRRLYWKEHLLILMSRLRIFFIYEALKVFIKRIKSKKLRDYVNKDLTDYDRKKISDLLKG